MGLTLGLDLGTNSIGWALVRQGDPMRLDALEGCGVRIFEPSVEDGWEHTPKNKGRRVARGARRTIQRAANRRKQLRKQLVEAGLLPDLADAKQPEKALDEIGDPYDLRKRALDERLEPHQVGRVLLHLCVRRGFLSNRKERWGDLLDWDEDGVKALIHEIEKEEEEQRNTKSGGSAAERKVEEDERKVLEGIKTLHEQMEATERDRPDGRRARTLGEYLAGLPKGERKRARYTDRQMYEDEFEKVWEAQAKRHPALLTDELKERVHCAIFHQRPLNLKKGRGHCSLEPRLPCAAMARLESQRFRLLQDVNNLEVAGVFQAERPIGLEQRRQLADALEQDSFVSWAVVRRTLFGGAGQKVKMKMEVAGSKDKGLTGNRTAAALRRIIQWDAYDEEKRKRLVNDLVTIRGKVELFKCLRRKWGFEPKTALRLAVTELEEGYASLSLKAINNLLPHMEQGKRFDQARQAVAQDSPPGSGMRERYGYETPESRGAKFLGAPPNYLRNPAVEKALHELRKVVNAVIRTHGRPDVIRVELARDLKKSKKDRERIEKQQKRNRHANEQARKAFEEVNPGKPIPGATLIKHRLWIEQGHECAYTVGKCISLSELFSEEVEIDHIIPYSLHPDDSWMNKVVCMRGKNREKGNKTPWQVFGNTQEWETIEQRFRMLQHKRALPPAKAQRLLSRDEPRLDGFLNHQLPDTGYIGKEATKYLEQLSGVKVDVTKGGVTSRLRLLWELNAALGGPPGEKSRSDHRHHALDAAVIAVTDRSVYQALSEAARLNVEEGRHSFTRRRKLDMPWPDFGQAVKDGLAHIVVSHAPLRKLSGALHEDTGYGLRYVPSEGEKRFVTRKMLDSQFTKDMAKKVVDATLREAIQQRMDSVQNPRDAFKTPFFHPQSGARMRHVRIFENFKPRTLYKSDTQTTRGGDPYKHHRFRNNHHVEIFRNRETGKVERPRFVTMMKAAARARGRPNKEPIRKRMPIVDRNREGCEFLMSLAINDMVELDEGGADKLYRVQQLEAPSNLLLRRHEAAPTGSDATPEQKKADKKEPLQVRMVISKLVDERKMRKVNVSPIGELREARD